MKPEWIMWLGIFLLIGLLASIPPTTRVPDNTAQRANTAASRSQGRDYDENGKRLTEYPGDPMAGTTKSRMYIENYERARAAWAERHTSVVPQYALNYWEANHGSGSR